MQKVKETRQDLTFQSVFCKVSSKACLTGYASFFFFFSISPGENDFRLLVIELIFTFLCSFDIYLVRIIYHFSISCLFIVQFL